jgi:hypothetical protein
VRILLLIGEGVPNPTDNLDALHSPTPYPPIDYGEEVIITPILNHHMLVHRLPISTI